jgi:flagellar motor component MotA
MIILGILIFLFLLFSSLTIINGTKTGELSKKIINPLKSFASSIYKSFREEKKSQSIETIVNINTESSFSTSSGLIEIDNNRNSENSKFPNSRPTQYNWVTPAPNPTVIKWQENFDKKWDEMQQNNEKSLKDFCQKMPNASVCK